MADEPFASVQSQVTERPAVDRRTTCHECGDQTQVTGACRTCPSCGATTGCG